MKKVNKCSFLLLTISALVIVSCQNLTKYSEVEFIDATFDFGTLSIRDTLTHTFLLKNSSKNDLLIQNAVSSCGCTTFKFVKSGIVENDTAKIKVQFIPDKLGYAEKTIVVEANTNPPYNILVLKGTIKE